MVAFSKVRYQFIMELLVITPDSGCFEGSLSVTPAWAEDSGGFEGGFSVTPKRAEIVVVTIRLLLFPPDYPIYLPQISLKSQYTQPFTSSVWLKAVSASNISSINGFSQVLYSSNTSGKISAEITPRPFFSSN